MTGIKENNPKILGITFGIIIIVLAITGYFFLIPGISPSSSNVPDNSSCRVDWTGKLVDPCVPLMKIVNGTNDSVYYDNFSVWSQREAAPTPDECKVLAVKALEPFGGLPADSVITDIKETSHWGLGWEGKPGYRSEVGNRRVYYQQSPYGMPIYGNGGSMTVELSFGGNLSNLQKHWLTLEESGMARVIPASAAIEKLGRGEVKNMPAGILNLTVNDMRLGYYTPVNATVPQYLEPVWVANVTDEIHNQGLALFVPAEDSTGGYSSPGGIIAMSARNFSQLGGTVPQPNVRTASNILIGTTGPVGVNKALDSIQKFTGNPEINLTYNGRFIEQEVCGPVYFWNYYDFTSPNCSFKVETYTGIVLSGSMNRSCSEAGIPALLETGNSTPGAANSMVVNFTRDRFPLYDNDYVTVAGRDIYRSTIIYHLTGNSSNIYATFDAGDGSLIQYGVYDRGEIMMCGNGPVRVGY